MARRSGGRSGRGGSHDLPGVVDGPTPTPTPRVPARRRADESPTATVCNICGLRATPQKPLVHANCLTDEVPF